MTSLFRIGLGMSLFGQMHEAVENSRDRVIRYTRGYERSPYTRKQSTGFEAERVSRPPEPPPADC
jgi:hypothetical protein